MRCFIGKELTNVQSRKREWLKTGLIALLLTSAIFLGYSSSVFAGLAGAFSRTSSAAPAPGITSSAPAEAARPGVLVLTNADLQRAVFKYDMDALDLIYNRVSGVVGEALGALSKPEKCSETDFRAALQGVGIMFEYHSVIPLELIRDWLGASGDGYGISLRRICLAFETGSTTLYFENGDSFYVSQTTSLGSELAIPATYDPDVMYQFELGGETAPYMIIGSPEGIHSDAVGSNPITTESELQSAVSALGVDLRQTSGYTDTDGTRVYISSSFSLYVSPEGVVTYRRTSDDSEEKAGLSDAVELARRTAALTIGALSGEARIYFTGYSYSGNAVNVEFDYFFAGGRVFLPGYKNAATITVSGGVVSEALLCFRSYEPGEAAGMLPEIQALSISDGEFALGYADSALASPFWYGVKSVSGGGAL